MRKTGTKSQVHENAMSISLDTGIIPQAYYAPMKTKKQPVFNLRFTKSQKEAIRRAAKAEGRSMHNYILRTVLAKAAADLNYQAQVAVDSLAS